MQTIHEQVQPDPDNDANAAVRYSAGRLKELQRLGLEALDDCITHADNCKAEQALLIEKSKATADSDMMPCANEDEQQQVQPISQAEVGSTLLAVLNESNHMSTTSPANRSFKHPVTKFRTKAHANTAPDHRLEEMTTRREQQPLAPRTIFPHAKTSSKVLIKGASTTTDSFGARPIAPVTQKVTPRTNPTLGATSTQERTGSDPESIAQLRSHDGSRPPLSFDDAVERAEGSPYMLGSPFKHREPGSSKRKGDEVNGHHHKRHALDQNAHQVYITPCHEPGDSSERAMSRRDNSAASPSIAPSGSGTFEMINLLSENEGAMPMPESTASPARSSGSTIEDSDEVHQIAVEKALAAYHARNRRIHVPAVRSAGLVSSRLVVASASSHEVGCYFPPSPAYEPPKRTSSVLFSKAATIGRYHHLPILNGKRMHSRTDSKCNVPGSWDAAVALRRQFDDQHACAER